MKPLHVLKPLSMLAALFLCLGTAFASPGSGSIMGQVTDPETKEPLEFATVVFESEGMQKVFTTDEKGFYYASNIPAGNYTVTVSYLSKTMSVENIKLASDEVRELNLAMGNSVDMKEIIILTTATNPLINPVEPTTHTLTTGDIRKAPISNTEGILTMLNIPEIEGGYYVRGARDGGVAWYIDGCKIMGNPNVPICGVQIVKSYTGFIPAKYGDTNGGVVAIETRSWFTE